MKTSPNICKHTDELITERVQTHGAGYFVIFSVRDFPSCLGSQGGLECAITRVCMCVHVCVCVYQGVLMSDHLASAQFVFHFRSLKQ